MKDGPPARFTRPKHVELELVAVAYRDRSFPVHIHDDYVLGVIEGGAERLEVNGTSHLIDTGDLITIEPGLAHSNHTLGSEVLRYRVFYLPPELVASFSGCSNLRFAAPWRNDPVAGERLLELHRWFEAGTGDRLEQESAVAEIIEIAFDAGDRPDHEPQLPEAVDRARRYIDEHYPENFGLDELAAAAEISKFHLARSFSRSHGLSPLAYRTQRRIHAARRLILKGTPLADIAIGLGFADQSHLTRQFQSIVGISPARYREQ
ncbi:AraC family transcriptional regulator [Blastomonas marina]|uniref:AraC family transcriptional regulator n=1 Tax=Blastomonas marina TaxID=1867408 RepID=A0ABQ1FFM2_9SPHN|nr:AraC family transcriptional regulator [Blastomonas marina]GGA09729.1 AraC family transcriptional regulator [Blastomonas marina]